MVELPRGSQAKRKSGTAGTAECSKKLLRRYLALAVVKRCRLEKDAPLRDFGDAGAADGGSRTGDKTVKPLPGFLKSVRDRAGADITDLAGETVDELAADSSGFELHAGELHDT
jgi:hypothetical protein